MPTSTADLALVRGALLALAFVPGRGWTMAWDAVDPAEHPNTGGPATPARLLTVESTDPVAEVARIEAEYQPRWLWWDTATARALVAGGLRVGRCWDLAAVHRLLFGGWRTDPAQIWAAAHGLDPAGQPGSGQLDLLGASGDDGGDPDHPLQTDGYLRPEWVGGGWQRAPDRWAHWARILLRTAHAQQALMVDGRLDPRPHPARILTTARSESAAELLCAELGHDGIPVERSRAEEIVASVAGPRPHNDEDAAAIRHQRDRSVLDLVPGLDTDLRSPLQVKALLARIGIEVRDTRSWRLEVFSDAHPVVPALLRWRKAERFATTYGYDWLDRQVGRDGRLRGGWTGCDGGAGRMTATAGLHSLPAELRPAVRAEPGWRFVRADLGQIEPRVLAGISRDPALIAATGEDDLYAPVAARIGVDRPTAKVAVLAAMYGQTSGAAGEALQGMEAAYPVAMRFLKNANESGRAGRSLRTYGGRLLLMYPVAESFDEQQRRAALAGRGRYARNAMVQGAAAEFFKTWAAVVRARIIPFGAQIVLCLHDELLVHVPAEHAERVGVLVTEALAEAARSWAEPGPGRVTRGAGGDTVRFVADVSVVERWSQAKA
ncbi:DNA polymerase [Jatrophihabitans telluris]|uniref:DNA-directed DNA polymerase n=1 Tax=Jatrophihabitans telluris TaxID=2038343 RepID=A0ABY4R114_9ACTN|nr:DNA polymerase [Jatrophihabitans telluris]UQX89465.1 DNA polymerase [Jatrophihabitans telluris]